jgi:pyruvate dehydrogenase E2 component (dihydrolipoamide acetyltransferase)
MSERVKMPALGESVTEGTVTRWLKQVGERVEIDEPLLEVSTDKVDTEIPSPVSGVLARLMVGEDETVPVGAELATVADSVPAAPADAAPSSDPAAAARPVVAAPTDSATAAPAAGLTSPGRFETPPSSAQPDPAQPGPAQPGPALPGPTQPSATPAVARPTPAAGPITPAAAGPSLTEASVYVTPLVRKLAAEHGVDLSAVAGTGVGGRVRKQDVLDAAQARRQQEAAAEPAASTGRRAAGVADVPSGRAAASASAKRGTTEKMSRLRRLIAQRMVESMQTSAQLTTVVEVDVTKIARLRDRAKADFKAREGVGLSFLPFFAQAAVEALKVHPNVNASLEGDEVAYHAQENLGIAVDTEKGLIVPVIRDAGGFNIAGMARKIADLAARTRASQIGPDELGGGTFTLTNTGSRGALFDTPIVNLPQVAILGTGAVVKRPVVVRDLDGGETIAIRSMVYLALSYDHRIVDGADAARFLTTMKDRLEEGAFDADLGL